MTQLGTGRFDLTGELSLKKGCTRLVPIALTDPDGALIDLDGAILSARLRDIRATTFLGVAPVVTYVASDDYPLRLFFDADLIGPTSETGLKAGLYWYDVLIEFAEDRIWCPLEGEALVRL